MAKKTVPLTEQATRPYTLEDGQRVAAAAVSASSAAVGTSEVTVHATVDCYIKWGASPQTADNAAGNMPLAAGEKFTFQMNPEHIIAVIRDSADGYLFIMPIPDA